MWVGGFRGINAERVRPYSVKAGSMAAPPGKSRRSWTRKIGTKIILVALITGLVPIVLISCMLFFKTRNDLIAQAVSSQEALTE